MTEGDLSPECPAEAHPENSLQNTEANERIPGSSGHSWRYPFPSVGCYGQGLPQRDEGAEELYCCLGSMDLLLVHTFWTEIVKEVKSGGTFRAH